MDNNSIIDLFGNDFIKKVRDESIEEYETIKAGKMKSVQAQKITSVLSSFTIEELEKIDFVTKQILDRVLHKTMWFFEQSDSWSIGLKEEITEHGLTDLADMSDGLTGELYSEEGWINKFSTYSSSLDS